MTEAEFKKDLEKINLKLGLDFIAITNKDKMFVMPINMFVSRDREGLIEVWRAIKKMNRMGIFFEKQIHDKR